MKPKGQGGLDRAADNETDMEGDRAADRGSDYNLIQMQSITCTRKLDAESERHICVKLFDRNINI